MAETADRCVYCKAACDGTLRDHYGEWVLRRDLPVCASCDNDLTDESGPWDEVR